MPDKTTIVLILIAGDSGTADPLDRLLGEVQSGIKNLPTSMAHPKVYCLYQRCSVDGQVFAMTASTPEMLPDSFGGLTNFPPVGSFLLNGNLVSQVTSFLEYVDVNVLAFCTGPVHIFIGAHGKPALGFHPTLLFKLFLSLLFSPFNLQLRGMRWKSRFLQLRDRLFRIGHPPGAIASGSSLPDLTLDDTAKALEKLRRPPDAIILHTCNLSGIETMSALNAAKIHIACESLLSSVMKVSKWFGTLANPTATLQQVTDDCFNSMKNDPGNADGCFSSHLVAVQDLQNKLNVLGSELRSLLVSNVEATVLAAESAINVAQSTSESRFHNCLIDLVWFCEVLHGSAGLPSPVKHAAEAVISAVNSLQLGHIKTSDWDTSPKYQRYSGINVYLPLRNQEYYLPELLPKSFRTGACEWFEFVKLWGGSVP